MVSLAFPVLSNITSTAGITTTVLKRAKEMFIKVIIPKFLRIIKSEIKRALKPPMVVKADANIALPILELEGGLLEMGGKLNNIGEGLEIMLMYSDASVPSIPRSQSTLDKMVYDEDGSPRDMFSELIIDGKYAMFMVKFQGNVDDATKSEITSSIKDYMDNNKLQSASTLVSGIF